MILELIVGNWVNEVHYYAKRQGYILPRVSFCRLVREIAQDIVSDLRFQAEALAALQEITESTIIMWFEMGYKSIL
jgi:histone H3